MDPMTMLALTQLGAGLLQSAVGGATMLTNKRPEYKTPPAIDEAVARARKSTLSNMPGYESMIGGIDLNQANAIETAKLSGDPSKSAATIQAASNSAKIGAGAKNAEYQAAQEGKLMAALGQKAQDDQLKFQMNEFAPYMEKQQFGQNMIGAGIKNSMGAIDMKAGEIMAEKQTRALMAALGQASMFGSDAIDTVKDFELKYNPSLGERLNNGIGIGRGIGGGVINNYNKAPGMMSAYSESGLGLKYNPSNTTISERLNSNQTISGTPGIDWMRLLNGY